MIDSKKFGKSGEKIAAKFLVDNGYCIIEENYKFGRGEIDLIVHKDDTLIFVEVKTRRNLEYGPPEMAISKSKQKQIRKIAEGYLYQKKIRDKDCRIDVIAITFVNENEYLINHIENAF